MSILRVGNSAQVMVRKDRSPRPNDEPCESCLNQGWLIFQVSGSSYMREGGHYVLRCDACEKISSDDKAAPNRSARGSGLQHGWLCSDAHSEALDEEVSETRDYSMRRCSTMKPLIPWTRFETGKERMSEITGYEMILVYRGPLDNYLCEFASTHVIRQDGWHEGWNETFTHWAPLNLPEVAS